MERTVRKSRRENREGRRQKKDVDFPSASSLLLFLSRTHSKEYEGSIRSIARIIHIAAVTK
jgi:hypothetical protein